MIRSFPGPHKGQREPGWKVSMMGSRLISAPASRSLLPGLVLSRVSQSRPWCKPPRGQILARPSSFLFLSSDPAFLPLPPGLPSTGSEASSSQDGAHFSYMTYSPQGKKAPLPHSITYTRLQVRTEEPHFVQANARYAK